MAASSLLLLLIPLAAVSAQSVATIQETRFPAELRSSLSTAPCRVAGEREVPHGQQIARDDPCEFCICIDSNVFCWWGQQHCSSNISMDNSTDSSLSSWSEAMETTESNSTDSSTTFTTTTYCIVMGRQYSLGAVLPRDTGTCLECVCAKGGRVTCSPKDCVHPSDDFHNSDPSSNSLDMFDVDVF